MANVNVTIRLDEETKKQFEHFCDNVGLNITVAINMFIKATLRNRELPFSVTDKNTFGMTPGVISGTMPGSMMHGGMPR